MALHHHRAARRQGGGGVAPRHREGQREVRGAEHRHRADRDVAPAQVRRGSGCRLCCAGSIVARIHAPERTRSANSRSCPTVRARSPSSRARGRPVSAIARSTSGAPRSAMPSATASRQRARVSGGVSAKCGNAASASVQAASTSRGPAAEKAGSRGAPVAGSTARKSAAVVTSAAPIRTLPRIVTDPGDSLLIQLG